MAALSRKVMEYGVDGIYYDTTSGNCYQCFNPNHGHPVGGGNYWFTGNRKLFRRCREEMRKANPEAIITSENPCEVYIDVVDGFLIFMDHVPNHIPLFQAIYHDYTFLYGNTLATAKVMGKDYPATLPIGISFINGDQLGWFAIWHLLIKPEYREELAWLRKLAHFRQKAAQKYLAFGELVRPPEIENALPTVSGDWGLGMVERPAVLRSAWKADDGSLGLVFCNISKESQRIVLRFNKEDYGFKADSKLLCYALGLDAQENPTRKPYKVFSGKGLIIEKSFRPLEVWAVEIRPSQRSES